MSKQEGHVQDSADWGWSLPSPYFTVLSQVFAQIVTGEKKASYLSKIMFLVPPKQEYQRYTNATHSRTEDIRNPKFASSKVEIEIYIPMMQIYKHPSRRYMWNIGTSFFDLKF